MKLEKIVAKNGTVAMKFAQRFKELTQSVETYKMMNERTEHEMNLIDCELVADIITVILDEFGFNDLKED